MPVAVEQHQDATLEFVDRRVDGVAGFDRVGRGDEVRARQLGVAGRDACEHHRQMRFRAHRCRTFSSQRERAAGEGQRLLDATEQRADHHANAVPAQQRGRRRVGLGAEAVDLPDDAVEPLHLAGPEQVVGERAQQDALARDERLVEQALGQVGERSGQRVCGLAVDEGRQQTRQHAQVGVDITLSEVSGRVQLEHRHPGLERVEAGADEHDRVGSGRGGLERARRIAGRFETALRALEMLQGLRRVDGQLAVAEPVPRLRAGARGLGQREDPFADSGRAPLCHEARGMCVEETERFLPRAGGDELCDGRIGMAVRCEYSCGTDTQRPQRIRIQRALGPGAQVVAEQGVEGVGRRRAVAPIGEEAAARELGKQVPGPRVAADRHRHRCGGTRQEGDAHQRSHVGRAHLLHHFTGEECEQPVVGRATAQRVARAEVGACGKQQDHGCRPAAGELAQLGRRPGPAVQRDEALGVVFAEAQRRLVDHHQLLAGEHTCVLGRWRLAANGDQTRMLGPLGQRGGDAGVQQRRAGQLLRVVEHERPGQVECEREAAETAANERRHVAQVVGTRQGQAQWAARRDQRGGSAQEVNEGRGVGVAAIELQPHAGNAARFEVGRDQRGLADAGRAGDPDAGNRGRAIKLREQTVATKNAAEPRRAQFAERGLAGGAGAWHRHHLRSAGDAKASPTRVRSNAAVAHPVGGLEERGFELLRESRLEFHFLHRRAHAREPLIAFENADAVGHVARAQHRVAEALGVVLRATEPAAQKPEELVARTVERPGVQRANFAVGGVEVHQVVETVDQHPH